MLDIKWNQAQSLLINQRKIQVQVIPNIIYSIKEL